jgi:hypothetical protein
MQIKDYCEMIQKEMPKEKWAEQFNAGVDRALKECDIKQLKEENNRLNSQIFTLESLKRSDERYREIAEKSNSQRVAYLESIKVDLETRLYGWKVSFFTTVLFLFFVFLLLISNM